MDELYDNASATRRIHLNNDFYVDFAKHFKYLGSHISYHPRDNYDINQGITQGNQAMGALKHFWNNHYVDMHIKY